MDTELKNRLKKAIEEERKKGYYLGRQDVKRTELNKFMLIYYDYHAHTVNELSIRGTIKILFHKIVNKFSNK